MNKYRNLGYFIARYGPSMRMKVDSIANSIFNKLYIVKNAVVALIVLKRHVILKNVSEGYIKDFEERIGKKYLNHVASSLLV